MPSNAEKRTRDCQYICKAIRFPGRIGGCNCNFILFTKRSSELRSFETEVENLEQLRPNMVRNADMLESDDLENDDEKFSQGETPRNLMDLFRKQVINPILRDY
ncbi:hypothetical protein JTE90_023662 [Oedothorax gibbosus]|uniref:Uncharacterized protein n=1 Tax=Oedothorax gibbosus TaxID=931172 RepID=A0AAV6V1D1_9ARAC|nr:hypothetical protein JTE90_023662 [Oedothorax gibbosus]